MGRYACNGGCGRYSYGCRFEERECKQGCGDWFGIDRNVCGQCFHEVKCDKCSKLGCEDCFDRGLMLNESHDTELWVGASDQTYCRACVKRIKEVTFSCGHEEVVFIQDAKAEKTENGSWKAAGNCSSCIVAPDCAVLQKILPQLQTMEARKTVQDFLTVHGFPHRVALHHVKRKRGETSKKGGSKVKRS